MEKTRTAARIIIVDDMIQLTEVIESILRDNGYTNCKSYDDPEEALRDIIEDSNVGLIITDYRMPQMNGIELLDRARRIGRELKGLIVSAETSQILAQKPVYPVMEKGEYSRIVNYVKGVMS
ncbi:MAG: response regulator [Fibrobacter sp.]|nr:response regulator [Fibrobacter sp.]